MIEKTKKNIQESVKTAGIMAKGILLFVGVIVLAWTFVNFDILTKTIRYPEAVRELKIDVRVSQFSK